MIIYTSQLWDDWADKVVTLSHVISWWFQPPYFDFHSNSKGETWWTCGSDSRIFYSDGPLYTMGEGSWRLTERLNREVDQFVFVGM